MKQETPPVPEGSGGVVHTYGAPAVGDQQFANCHACAGETFRIVNDCDIVARLPGLDSNQHVGRPGFLGRGGEFAFDTPPQLGFWDSIYKKLTVRPSIDSVRNQPTLRRPTNDLTDHAPIEYVRKLAQHI